MADSLDPTVHRLKELLAKSPRLFKANEKDVIQRAVKFGASPAQSDWLETILEKVEPDEQRRAGGRQKEWDECPECSMCGGHGMTVLRKAMELAEKSMMMPYLLRNGSPVPNSEQYRECAFYCTCRRGKLLIMWQNGRTDALEAWKHGWRTREEFEKDQATVVDL